MAKRNIEPSVPKKDPYHSGGEELHMAKKASYFLGVMLLLFALAGCGAPESEETVKKDVGPNRKQMQNICELATLECYYHNTAKLNKENKILWWDTNTELWVEYSGIVRVGVEISDFDMKVEGSLVTITMPKARILSCEVDENSLKPDSYLVSKQGLGAKDITADDQTEAFKAAQENMQQAAEADTTLLLQGQQRAQELLEKYVKNVGEAIGETYQVEWVTAEAP